MKILIIESNESKIERDYSTTSIVHVRNSVIIADYLKADLISVEDEIPSVINNKYDVIICAYASGYQMYRKYVKILLNNRDAKIFWLVNEYSVPDNIILRHFIQETEIGICMLANVERHSYKQSHLNLTIAHRSLNEWIDEWSNVNLNVLIFDNSFVRSVKQDLFCNEKTDCLYYSTFRPDRTKDLLDYNDANIGISTSKKNVVTFNQAGVKARFGRKLSWERGKEDLYNYKYSLYLEDTWTHTNYNHMANRFYECLMLDVLQFFDSRCQNTITLSGYTVDEFMIVKNGTELTEKIKQIDSDQTLYDRLLESQRSNLPTVLQEKKDVLKRIKEIIYAPKIKVVREPVKEEDKKAKREKKVEEVTQTDIFTNQ